MGTSKRLSIISATKEIFDRGAPVYEAALDKVNTISSLSLKRVSSIVTTTKEKRKKEKET